MSETNGAGQPRRGPGAAIPRRGRLLIGAIAALVIAGVLIAPIVILSSPGGGKRCTLGLLYKDVQYTARPVSSKRLVQGVAIGVGVTSGCGTSPSNIGVRSLVGVRSTVAVGLSADQASVYVRRGLCTGAAATALLACLKRS